MRVLVVAAPLLGHVFPLMPLALALRDNGHEVVVATGGEALRVSDSGLPVEDVAPAALLKARAEVPAGTAAEVSS